MRVYAIIAASGLGKRMKLRPGQSKQYLKIGRYPVIYYTLSAFEQAKSVQSVIVATIPEYIANLRRITHRHGFSKVSHIIEGGKERQDSIYNCIQVIKSELDTLSPEEKAQSVILIHDGVRPFIQPDEIDQVAAFSHEFGACVPATKPKDTIKFVGSDPQFFGETLDRSKLVQVQTPQGFRAETIIQAHNIARAKSFYTTDDAALCEAYFPEQKIKIFETGYHNIKITTPEDMEFGQAILKGLQRRANRQD